MTDTSDPRAGFRAISPLRVRYAECDQQGVVFNGHYMLYADLAGTEYFRQLTAWVGGDVRNWGQYFAETGGDTMVRTATLDYRAPARSDDVLDLCARVARIGTSSFDLIVRIVRDGTLLNEIRLTYVHVRSDLTASMPLPERFRHDVAAFEILRPDGLA